MLDTTIDTPFTPGLADGSIYLLLFSGATVFNGTAFVTPVTANWNSYGLDQPETPVGFGKYSLDFAALAAAHPSAIVANAPYSWKSYLKAGGTRVPSDAFLGDGKSFWDGTQFIPSPISGGGQPQTVDQDYLGTGNLIVESPPGTPIAGATVTAYLAGTNTPVMGTATTDSLGRWSMPLNPSAYTLIFAFGGEETQVEILVK